MGVQHIAGLLQRLSVRAVQYDGLLVVVDHRLEFGYVEQFLLQFRIIGQAGIGC